MDIQALRDALPVTRDAIYMNTGWAGPTPGPVLRRIQETLEQEARVGPASPEGLAVVRGATEEAREAIAALIGADTGDVAFTHGTREGVNVVIHGMAWQPGDELLTCDLEHPAVDVPSDVLTERYGVKVERAVVSPSAGQAEALEAIVSAITPKTRLVALSHIQFTCGLRMPIREIAEAAHAHGVPVLVDGAQSVGQVAVDMADLGADFYALSGQKWLLGPVGTGALYVNPEIRGTFEPVFTTNALEDGREHPRSPILRYAIASQSPGLAAGFAEAVRLVSAIGIEVIERRVMALADRLRARVAPIPGCTLLGPASAESACALVSLALDGWAPDDLATALEERFHVVARRVDPPAGVRFSVAYFNTEDEVDRVAQALEELAKEGPQAS